MGGVGKTQLAARYARKHRDEYDVIWWVRAEQEPTLRADLAGLAIALDLADARADQHDAVAAARQWLEQHGRWLVVFDNAIGPDSIAGLLPEGSSGHVLITSRAHADWRALHAQPQALNVWQRIESVEFLRERTEEQDMSVVDAVADALGDLPLALEQAAAYTNINAITLSEYIRRVRDRAPELFSACRPLSYEHSVSTVWQLAFEEIAQQPVASDLLAVCAHLAPDSIPRELLEAAAHARDVSTRAVDEAIGLLLRYALLAPAGKQTFGMHRLIGAFTRGRSDPAVQARAAAAAVTALDALWPPQPWEHEQWPACERLLAHALAATEHSQRHGVASEQTGRMLERAGQYEAARAQSTSAERLMKRALAIKERVYGAEHSEVASTLTSLGIVQQRLGELGEARATQQRALAINEEIFGPEHPEVAGTLRNLGNMQQVAGELGEARVTLQRAVAINEEIFGPEHPEVAGTLISLGVVQELLGELEEARATQQRALAINDAVYGPTHPHVAGALTNLGIVQQRLGQPKQARLTLQRALAINEAVLGSEHPDVAITLTNLGNVQRQLGELEQARATQQRALTIDEAIFGADHAQVASTLTNLGKVQQQLEEPEEAHASMQRALAIYERVFTPDHKHAAQARSLVESPGSSTRAGSDAGIHRVRRYHVNNYDSLPATTDFAGS
jgi:tetratricopeptide (TPR) repeat protein